MSDLAADAKFLRFYYTSDETLLDKDYLKNEAYEKYQSKVTSLFLVPFGFQLWQLYLVNNFEQAALYRKVRILKAVTFGAALFLGVQQKWDLEKKWLYLNRMYPEPTELQKTLYRDAMMFKEIQYTEKPLEERTKLDVDTVKIYE